MPDFKRLHRWALVKAIPNSGSEAETRNSKMDRVSDVLVCARRSTKSGNASRFTWGCHLHREAIAARTASFHF